jgi:hypothetical protein
MGRRAVPAEPAVADRPAVNRDLGLRSPGREPRPPGDSVVALETRAVRYDGSRSRSWCV